MCILNIGTQDVVLQHLSTIKYPMQFNPLFQLTFRLNVDLNFIFVTKKIKMCLKCPVHIVPVYLLIGNMFI